MNYRKLEILVAIDKFNNITKAAHHLKIKQPTVTFHMKGLEEETQTKLFQTNASKTVLTSAGKAILFYAQKILQLADDAQKVVKEFNDPEGYHITIGSSSVPSIYVLPEIIGLFKNTHPNAMVSITVMTAPEIQTLISNYELSLGIISSTDLLLENIPHEKLCTDKMVLIYAKENPLNQYAVIDKAHLENEKFILHTQNSTTRMLTDKWATDLNLNIKTSVEINSTEAIKRAVMCNVGISILSELSVREEIASGKLAYAYLPGYSPSRNIYLVYNEDRYMPEVLKDFIKLLKHQLSETSHPA
ncbi:LysR family transcriptional regulator [Fusibacter sp. 3D3]|uniref:LysR family transcriptional regulator n=1 Tax=Fusibacter sp. 3D3 TaxID=1048380 RepID=UPI0008536CA2|nr:LysR family transcriptional regulator [Fusibacter sp. 3D3]GAU79235.1 LysR family transcriptional regulator YeiE [Fusibacter sp. 3D3]